MGRVAERTVVDLIKYQKDRDARTEEKTFFVMHCNGSTNLEQKLMLKRDCTGTWIAEMCMDEFPRQSSEKEAAKKLADWMCRMSVAINSHFLDE